jgi:hypothetical protein
LEVVRNLVESGVVKAKVFELLIAQQQQHGSAPEGLAPITSSVTSAEVRGKMEDVSSTAAKRGEFAQQNPMAQQRLVPIPACITNAEVLSKLEEVRRLVANGLVKPDVYELLVAQQQQQRDGAPGPQAEGLTPIPASIIDVEVRSKLEVVRSLVECGLVKAEVYELLLAQQHQDDEGPSLYSNFTYYRCEKKGHLVPACVM